MGGGFPAGKRFRGGFSTLGKEFQRPQLTVLTGLSFINHARAGGAEGGGSLQEGICLLGWGES